jgi:hypothetical protein
MSLVQHTNVVSGSSAAYCRVVFGPSVEEATARDLRSSAGKEL